MLYLEGRPLEMKPAYLMTKNEKYVFVESRGSGSTPQMVARSVQVNHSTNSRKVTVTVIENMDVDKVKCMAFCFELNNKKYFPVVTGDKIGFEETLTSDMKFWFRWGEKTGQWRTLQSAAKSDMSLCECNKGKVIICSQPRSHFRISFKDMARSPITRLNNIPMYQSTRYNDDSTQRMVVENLNITHNGNLSEEKNDIKMIQDEIPVYRNTRYRKYMSIQSNDESICQMVVQNFKISHNGNPSEESRPEMIQDSRPMYLKTRHRQYMWVGSKDGSTSQMVVENIKISDDRNPRRGNKRIRQVYCSKETTEGHSQLERYNKRPSFLELPGFYKNLNTISV
ncbi:uncharacterized protein LOC130570472 isoform X2 [Triplophysa rosa]|uniref:uncharacterized protein LOC130570472 isoform X2 n=1 Tax=Triplophysa rosa TaxID=992332 RepID=UPI002546100C|nr:uncharacterized protein LOC130570472 isoform X2 [Triplophysa rosa]